MSSGYPHNETGQRDRWMVSYVDVLTILLIFFLVAAARSVELPTEKRAEPQAAAAPAPDPAGVAQAPPEEPSRANLIRAQEQLREHGLEPKLEPRGLVITLPQVILFPSGEDAVNPEALPTLQQIADVLREIPNHARLIGHADATPIHNRRFASNWDLSMARSRKILELLSGRYGIAESRLSITSFGPYRPIAPNDTVDGRASNRRVEILILDESDGESLPD